MWNSFTNKDTIVSDDGSSDSPTEDSKTFESAMATFHKHTHVKQQTDPTVLPSATSCADEQIDLATLDPDGIDAVDLVARGIHRTHYSSVERRRFTVIHKMKTFL